MSDDHKTPLARAQDYKIAWGLARQNAKTAQAMAKMYPAEADSYLQSAEDALARCEHYRLRAEALMEIARSEQHAA